MNKLNLRIHQALTADGIKLRPHASPGLWISFLLPAAFIISSLRTENVSKSYVSCAIYSFNILLNLLYLIYHIYKFKSINLTKKLNIFCGVPALITIFFYSQVLSLDFRRSVCYTIANALIYFEGILFLLKAFPKTFTFGEVNIAIQGLSLFIHSLFSQLNKVMLQGIPQNEHYISSIILLLSLSWILLFTIVPFLCKKLRNVEVMYIWGFCVIGMMYSSIYYILQCDFFLWIWQFLTKPERVVMVCAWLILSISAVIIVQHHISTKIKSSTIIRKYFHGLIVAVFLPGVLIDPNLLYFSSGCIFGIFIILEVFRILKIPPFHHFLSNGFYIYCDEKDSGILALTPICLLVGNSLPLWITPQGIHSEEMYLPLLSGVLSVGIGDTFASIGGKLVGKHKWKGSIKTVEGTLFGVLSQIFFVQALIYFNLLQISTQAFVKCLIAISVTSIVEAKTDQIDNIVLPLTMYILIMM